MTKRQKRQTGHAAPSAADLPDYVAGKHYGRAALSSARDRIETAPEGHRHATVFAAAAAGNLLPTGELRDEAVVADFLVAKAVTVGLPRTDAERTVRRGIERGKTTPRSAPVTRAALRSKAGATIAVVEWWLGVQSQPWPGAKGATDLRILAAFAILGLQAGKMRLDDSYRQIAETAGVSSARSARLATAGCVSSASSATEIDARARRRYGSWSAEGAQLETARRVFPLPER